MQLVETKRLKDYIKYLCLVGLSIIIIDQEELLRGGPSIHTLCKELLGKLDNI
jgi:hypothetical protein